MVSGGVWSMFGGVSSFLEVSGVCLVVSCGIWCMSGSVWRCLVVSDACMLVSGACLVHVW